MFASGVYDVLPTVGTDVLADRGHQRSQQVVAADDEAQLFTRVESEADRQQIDFDIDNLAGRELFNPVEAVGWHVTGRERLVEVAGRNAQPSFSPLYRRTLAP